MHIRYIHNTIQETDWVNENQSMPSLQITGQKPYTFQCRERHLYPGRKRNRNEKEEGKRKIEVTVQPHHATKDGKKPRGH